LTASAETAAFGVTNAPVGTLPTTGFAYTNQYRSAKLFFGASSFGGVANASGAYSVYGYHAVGTSPTGDASGNYMFMPQLLAQGSLLTGSATFGTSATVYGLTAASTDLIVDSITDTADLPGTYVQTSSLDVTAYIEFPLQGCIGIEVTTKCELTTGAMTSVSAFAKLQDDTYRPYA